MREKRKGTSVSVWMDQDTVDRLDKIAQKARITRSRLVSNMVQIGLEDVELSDKFGLLGLAIFLKDFKEKVSDGAKRVFEPSL